MKGKPQTKDWQWQQTEWKQSVNRIKTKDQVPKLLLRASAAADGSCFAALQKNKPSDKTIVGKDYVKKCLNVDSCHLLRRPGVGLSEAAGSISSGVAVLESGDIKEAGFDLFKDLMHGDHQFVEALKIINTGDKKKKSKSELKRAIEILCQHLQDKKKFKAFMEAAGKMAIASSRLYIASMHALQLAVLFKDPSFWSEGIPENTTQEADLQAWKDDPEDRDCMISALTDLLYEKNRADNNASEGGIAGDLFATWENESDEERPAPKKRPLDKKTTKKAKKHKKKQSSSTSSDDNSSEEESPSSSSADTKKHKKKAKKNKKTSAKEKKRAMKSKDKAKKKKSSSTTSEQLSSEKILKIRRISGMTESGKMVIKDDDRHDEVAFNEHDTLRAVLEKYFADNGMPGELDNFNVKFMQNDLLVTLNVASTLAKDHDTIVLFSKGG